MIAQDIELNTIDDRKRKVSEVGLKWCTTLHTKLTKPSSGSAGVLFVLVYNKKLHVPRSCFHALLFWSIGSLRDGYLVQKATE